MPEGFKVKLPDGRVYGPLASDLLRRWYEDGRINKDSPVLRPGSPRWAPLGQTVDVRSWGARGTRETARREAPPPTLGAGVRVAGVLFLLGALFSALRGLAPASWLPDLTGVPWMIMAGVQAALGLGLVLQLRAARILVLVLLGLAVVAYLGVGGVLVVKEVRGLPLLLIAFALVSAIGYFVLLLGKEHSRGRIATGVLMALLGSMATLAAEIQPSLAVRQKIEQWSSTDRRFSDQELGLTLDLPPGWVMLKSDNPIVKTPPGSRIVLAQPNLAAFAFLVVDRQPKGVASLDHYLDRLLQQMKKNTPELKELERGNAQVGSLPARTASAVFDTNELTFQGRLTVWQDGWNYFALFGGGVKHLAKRVNPELDALLKGFTVYGVLSTRLEQTLQRITAEVPHLSRISASMLMVDAAGRELAPEEAFRLGFELATKGLSLLPPDEVQQVLAINEKLYAGVSTTDRARLGAYFERLRAGQPTTRDQDAEMCRLLKGAVLRLPPETRQRLQNLYEKMLAPMVVRSSPVVVSAS